MQKFRSKPIEIEAIQVTNSNIHEVAQLLKVSPVKRDAAGPYFHWCGDIVAVGSYIYIGADGEYNKMEASQFESIYERIDNAKPQK
jgi:hypothetical protein